MTKRQQQFTGTRDVRDAHRFDVDALASYMTSHVEGFAGPLTVSQFKGGQSNPTYLLTSTSGLEKFSQWLLAPLSILERVWSFLEVPSFFCGKNGVPSCRNR